MTLSRSDAVTLYLDSDPPNLFAGTLVFNCLPMESVLSTIFNMCKLEALATNTNNGQTGSKMQYHAAQAQVLGTAAPKNQWVNAINAARKAKFSM